MAGVSRLASVLVRGVSRTGGRGPAEGARLAASLLAASPRVSAVGPEHCRADARGWERLGGEEALGRALVEAAREGGFSDVCVGIADVAVAADAAARLATDEPRIVPPGESDRFLSSLPLSFLPLPEDLSETLHALGLRRIGELAALDGSELEARFGPAGVRAHRWARGVDDRVFRSLSPEDPLEASLELEGPVAGREPLLFALRHLLARIREDLTSAGRCAAELELRLTSTGAGIRRKLAVAPARPTAREDLLFELCRAAVERELEGKLSAPVEGVALRVVRTTSPETRQGDLFLRGWRDPLAADAVLSRLRSRVGRDGVVRPAPRPGHRPETRSGWKPVEVGPEGASCPEPLPGPAGGGKGEREPAVGRASTAGSPVTGPGDGNPIPPSILRLLPRPLPVRVRASEGRPEAVWDGRRRHRVVAAEGPERLSGEWWKAPFRREYYRACTSEGMLLWIYRESGRGEDRWWLHGWWD